VSCLQVRDRLSEYVLGSLPPTEARQIERHVQRCAGCAKEVQELREGAATVALGIPIVQPSALLEERIVRRVQASAGRDPATGWRRRAAARRTIRALVVATAAALLLAFGAMGWAVAERHQARDSQQARTEATQKVNRLTQLLQSPGNFQARLLPPVPSVVPGSSLDEGTALIYRSHRGADFILVDVFLGASQSGPYRANLLNAEGRSISGGELHVTNNGDWVFYEQSGRDLSRGVAVVVLDKDGKLILFGRVHPVAG
jgi:hypothetical protein